MPYRVRGFAAVSILVAVAALAWGGNYLAYGDLEPVERWLYFAQGHSGPARNFGPTASPMVDVTGKFAGKTHCYTCDWLEGPALAVFIKPDDPNADRLAEDLDRLTAANKDGNLRACVVYLGGEELVPRLKQLAADRSLRIPLLYLEPHRAPEHLRLNPAKRNTLLLIQDHRVYQTFSDLTTVDQTVEQATATLIKEPDRSPQENPTLRYPGTPPRNPS